MNRTRGVVFRKLIAAALAAAFVVPGVGQAQSEGGSAGAFVGSQPPPTLADPVTTVPGAGENVSSWTGMWNNPTGLEQVGRDSVVGNELGGIVGNSSQGTAGQVSANDDWLQKSFGILRDPRDHTGELVTEPTKACETKQVTETKEETYVYTCESGTPTEESDVECKRQYVPVFDTDYVYECRAGEQWTSTPKTCEPERVVVVDEDYVYTCQTGTEWTQTPASCTRKRVVVVDEDYVYGCQLTWNGTTHAPNQACNAAGQPGCSIQGSKTCVTPSTIPSSYTCQVGTIDNTTANQCEKTWQTNIVGTFSYNIGDLLTTRPTGTAFNNQANRTAVAADVAAATGCRIPPAHVDINGGSGTGFTKLGKINGVDVFRWNISQLDCDAPLAGFTGIPFVVNGGNYEAAAYSGSAATAPLGLYKFEVSKNPWRSPTASGSWSTGCNTLGQTATCSKSSETCIDGPSTKIISGVPVTACWRMQETYQCGTTTPAPGCFPPSGMTQTGSTCLKWNGSVCQLTENTYGDPSGGCAKYIENYRCETQVGAAGPPDSIPRDVISDTWDNGCTALQGNGSCVKQSETVIEGNATKTINGLPVTRNPWEVREDYICWSSSNVNSCTPFTSCTQQSNVCSSTNQSGVCTAWQRTYLCENPATGGGTPTSTPREVVSEYWTDPCATNRNDLACKLTANSVLIGAETRTINGMSVTRDPWKRHETWACNTSSTVDTCGPVKTGCTLVGQTCAGTNPQGACSINLNRYRCEETKSGVGSPVEQPVDQIGGNWQDGPCPPKSDPNCQLQQANECTQGAETRTVDGHPATATCWEQTDTYLCQKPGPDTSNCQPAAGCTLKEKVCLDDENTPLSQCKAVENVYECKKVTETTHEETTCETKICVGQECYTQGGDDEEPGKAFPDALAALYVANEAGKDFSVEPTIFKGEPLRCRKAVLGFRNCCKDSGWGLELGLAQCDDQEKTLMLRQEAKAAHFVGTWCSKKSFFGTCMEKSMRYCAFEGSLAKIVQVEGRKQINKPWGAPKSPDCSGFTIEQFQQLDLSNVDFSEFTNDMMKKVMAPGEGGTVSRIQQSIEQMMGSGTPAAAPPLPGGGG